MIKKSLQAIMLLGIFIAAPSCNKIPDTNEELSREDATLTLFFIPSPFGINWESPRKLFTSMALNYFSYRPHFMGHVAVQVQCQDLIGQQHRFLTGMTSQKLAAASAVIFEHAGLGVMFEKNPGKFDDPKKSEQELIYRLKNPGATSGVNFIQYKINAAACTRIAKYYQEFKDYNLNRYYGLYSRPLYGEGAGCSAFGASFIELIGLMNEDMKKSWSYTLHLPYNLIGKPFTDNKVYVWELLKNKQWGIAGSDAMTFFFWEPDKMYHWVNKTLQNVTQQKNQDSKYQSKKIFNTQGLFVDASAITVPNEPIWKKTDRPFFSELLELNKQLYDSAL